MAKTISTNKVVNKIANEMYIQYAFLYQNSKRLSNARCLLSSKMSYSSITSLRNIALNLGILNEVTNLVEKAMGSEKTNMENAYITIKEILFS